LIAEEKLALARSLGATHALNAAATDVVKRLRREGGVHLALVSSGAKAAYDMAFYCLRPTGTLLVASRFTRGTRLDGRRQAPLPVGYASVDQANHALDLLRRGQAAGRIVLTPS
jgi:D-arabinose 1-dehydrogenase-like Zn-dependent alcohol dehydrogenase